MAFLAFGAGLAPSAMATPFFSAQAGVLSGADQESFSGSIPVSANAGAIQTFSGGGGDHQLNGTWAGESTAHADRGFLQASSHTSLNITDHQCCLAGTSVRAGGGGASFNIDDVLISGPGDFVDGILNLDLGGALSASADYHNALGQSGSSAQVTVGISFPGFGGGGGALLGAGAPPTNTLTLTTSGLLTGYSGTGALLELHLVSSVLPVGTPFSIGMSLDTQTVAFYNVFGTGTASVPIIAEAFASYTHTLSFSRGGPVFTLPDGYTVNSVDGGIVNNRFGGLPTVPEPATLSLIGLGLMGLELARRRRT